jgi:hypothetical protein
MAASSTGTVAGLAPAGYLSRWQSRQEMGRPMLSVASPHRRPVTASPVMQRYRIVPSRVPFPAIPSPQMAMGRPLTATASPPLTAIPRGRGGRSTGGGRALKRLEVGHSQPFKSWTSPDVVFNQIDKDKSGFVDILELKRFFRGTLDPAKLDAMFADLDADESGEVSIEEWRKGYYNAGFGESTIVGQSQSGLSALLGLISKPRAVDFSDLSHKLPPQRIHLIEERGITLAQLRDMWAHLKERCKPEGWMSLEGKLLTAETGARRRAGAVPHSPPSSLAVASVRIPGARADPPPLGLSAPLL